jgi:hypothetical protein
VVGSAVLFPRHQQRRAPLESVMRCPSLISWSRRSCSLKIPQTPGRLVGYRSAVATISFALEVLPPDVIFGSFIAAAEERLGEKDIR